MRLATEPDALRRLQEALDRLFSSPIGYDPFEQAAWALKGTLEACRQDVVQDFDEAEAVGDHSAADVARGRMRLLSPLIVGQHPYAPRLQALTYDSTGYGSVCDARSRT